MGNQIKNCVIFVLIKMKIKNQTGSQPENGYNNRSENQSGKSNKVKPYFIFLLIGIYLAIQFLFLKNNLSVLWDEAVYIGIGKYIYSGANIGLWENFRPLGFPLILGFLWKIKLDVILFGKIIALAFSALYIYVSYLIAKEIFNEKTAIISAVLISLVPVFFFEASKIMTEIPAGFFVLLAFYFFIKERIYLSAIFSGIAFLFKFPSGLIFLGLFLLLVIDKRFLDSAKFSGVFLLTIAPYLLFNMISSGNAFSPILSAASHQSNVVYAVHNTFLNFSYYLINAVKQNYLIMFFFLALFFYDYKNKKARNLFLILLIYLAYFSLIINKQERFMLIFLPLIVIISSYGILKFFEVFEKYILKKIYGKKSKAIFKLFAVFLIFLAIVPMFISVSKFYSQFHPDYKNRPIVSEYYEYFKNKNDTVILTTDPVPAAYTDKKFLPFYFSVFEAQKDYEMSINISDAVIYNPQAFQCEKISQACLEKQKQLEKKIKSDSRLVFNKTYDSETYFIFKRK